MKQDVSVFKTFAFYILHPQILFSGNTKEMLKKYISN